jgi:cyclic beta-1,2-glucan synthetase
VLSWTASCDALLAACEAEAWDGAWYRRAYFDDGTPLGSASNAECRIDSLAQSWAVLSGAADPARAAQAMNSVEQYLVRAEDGLVLLFTPPFDASPLDPGYIKGYLPGLRENGGQYTHAAVWVLMAQARLKDHAQVASLLDMLNPIRRSDSRSGVQAYRVEPYVLAADVYAGSAYARRGGWTWYTGAAGWMHRAIIESVLGLRIKGDQLSIDPCLPPHWNDFEAELNVDSLHYVVRVERVRLLADVVTELDGVVCAAEAVPLLKDGRRHLVRSTLL